jgi:uncharacterized delta-60 repeat protein
MRRAPFLVITFAGAAAWACGSSGSNGGGAPPDGGAEGSGGDGGTVVSACGATIHVDPSFGAGGVVSRPARDGIFPAALRVTSGGVLRFLTGSGGAALERLRADGSIDPGFDATGLLAIDAGTALSVPIDAIVLHDGGVALAYNAWPRGTTLVARLRADGAIDAAFGAGGLAKVAIDVGDSGVGAAVSRLAEGADGAIYLVGTLTTTFQNYPADVFYARVTAAGALDPSFGVSGVNVLTRPYFNVPFGAVPLSDARLLLGIYSEDEAVGAPSVDFAELWRVQTSGQPDPSFGPPDAGIALPHLGRAAVMLPLPGDHVLLGDIGGHVQKRSAEGATDPTFGDGGEVPYNTYLDDASTENLTVGLPLAAAADGTFASLGIRTTTKGDERVLVVFDANGQRCGPLVALPFADADANADRFFLAIGADGSIFVERSRDGTPSELTRFVR